MESDKTIPVISHHVPGYTVSWVSRDILQLQANDVLIYIKGIASFYNSEHSPFICWQGSGYEFKNLKKEKIGETEVYSGELQQGKNKLYTVWWFDNGFNQTTGQLNWRWRMLKGENKFAIINISAATKEELYKKVIEVRQHKTLNSSIQAVNL